jgi:hypothetical protein
MNDAKYDREIINRGTGTYEVQCYECEKWFESMRYDAVFCSATCRSRNHRHAQKFDKKLAQLKTLVNELITNMPREGESRTYQELTEIRNQIDRALETVDHD